MFITNLDRWDRREFLESFEQDRRLQDAEREGTRKQHNYSEFMVGIFGSMYKYNPKQRPEEDITPQTEWMDSIYNEIKQLPEWNSLRERTKLDPITSAAATAEFCLNFLDAVPEQDKHKYTKKWNEKYAQKPVNKTNDGVKQAFESSLIPLDPPKQNSGIDMSAVRRAARQACEAAAEEADKVNEAMNAIGYGNELGRRQTVAPTLKREMANRLFDNEQIRKIAELAGRMQRIAMSKQKSKIKHGTDEITDITIGSDLGRLVPSEMMKLSHPLLKLDFYKRFLEGSLVQYQLSGRESQGRGPLIICCDESWSMKGEKDIWSKAVALALLRIAQKQKRQFAMIHYDSAVSRVDIFGKRANPIEIMDAITHFTGRSTNFEKPLNQAMQIIVGEQTYKKADIVFICDGQAKVGTKFLNLFNDGRRMSGVNITSVLIDCKDDSSCRKFSDQIVHVNQGDDKDALNIMFNV